MPKYEVMLVVDGTIGEVDARLNIINLISLFDKLPDYEEKTIFSDPLAYPIRRVTVGHRFILNFVLDDPSVLFEFNRIALLNKSLLRYLVINENKDRSYRVKNNSKKIRDYEIRQEKFERYMEAKYKAQTNNAT